MEETTFDKVRAIKIPTIILGGLIVLTIVFGIFFYFNKKDPFWAAIFSGVATGLLVSIVQFVISWYEHNKIKRIYRKIIEFEQMGIQKILPHRDDQGEYRDRVQNTKKRLWVMGHTASRFIEDFANKSSPRTEKKVLFKILGDDNVKVRILIPAKEYLDADKQVSFDSTMMKMQQIGEKYPNFEVKYFEHKPAHSIFLFDDQCLLGPIFPSLASKDTPTLHSKVNGEFSEQYIAYFEKEWEDAVSIHAQ